jgi:hypothetical protein
VRDVGHSARSCWSDIEQGEEGRRDPAPQQQEEEGEEAFLDLRYGGGVGTGLTNGGGCYGGGGGHGGGGHGGGSHGGGGVQDVTQPPGWENHVQDVIKSTRFLVHQVAAQVDRKEGGDRHRVLASKNRSAAR